RDRAAHRGPARRAAATRLCGGGSHPRRPRGTRCASRRQLRHDALETEVNSSFMSVPAIKTPLPGPKAKALIDRDNTVVSPSYTRGYPLVIERGFGCMVEDVDGNVFLDCAAGIAVNSTGHSHPDVVKAITEQAQKFLHMSGTDFYYEPQVRL